MLYTAGKYIFKLNQIKILTETFQSVKIQMNKPVSEPLKHIPEDIELKNTIIKIESELKLKDDDDEENSSEETAIGKYIVEKRTKLQELLVKVRFFIDILSS